MPAFHYQAVDGTGVISNGTLDAQDSHAVVRALARRQLFATTVQPEVATHTAKISRIDWFPTAFMRRINRRDLTAFSRQLANLLGAGFPLTRALSFAGKHTNNAHLRTLVETVSADLAAGSTLHAALAKHPHQFDPLYLGMVMAGEESGKLATTFERLGHLREQADAMRSQLLGALTYPLIVLLATIGAVLVMLFVVIPRFATMFSDLGSAMPLPTEILLVSSEFLVNNWWIGAIGFVLLCTAWQRAWAMPAGRRWMERFRDQIPVLGAQLCQAAQARLCQTLAVMLEGGVSLIQALNAVRTLADSMQRDAALERARQAVMAGSSLADALQQARTFDPELLELIRLGEESGTLPMMLQRAGQLAEQQAAITLSMLTRILEPMLILVMGLVVGGVVAAMLLPIVQMNLGVN